MKGFLAVVLLTSCFSSCAPNNVTVDNSLGRYFNEAAANGCFGLLDNGSGEFTIYNLKRYRDSAFLPAATFDIPNALIGLQTGVITNDSMTIKWNGVQQPIAEWNKDLSMYQAFRLSAVPYFQEVARRIGKDTLQRWVDSVAYGTKKIKTKIDSFWLDGSLKITPDEELGLVKRLYFGQLPFFKVNQEIVKRAMLQEQNSAYTLAYKSGWGFSDSAHTKPLGWLVGWVIKEKQPQFFVLNLDSNHSNFDTPGQQLRILKSILQQLQLLPAKG